ncbi:MAG: lamin tail domain-containing protein [Bacteroidales bacterium]|jgi:Na+-transporting methylmalonyl-CoA/oxaloacetate decarboxylase gamma subunit|nr:lamin tail domain-containing protein [Bacteroidales bacterium]NPV35762.1 lamin tail domain-containing protein [Bacteroidales bacterium]
MSKQKLFILALIIFPLLGYSQKNKSLLINEILILNDSNYIDDFGERNGWIEIFNASYAPVDIGGMYLTNDLQNPRKYKIPKGDPRTIIPPRSYIVFYANNKPTHGILHLNFELKNSKLVALFESNGKKLVDKMMIPADAKPDISYGRLEDGGTELGFLKKTTPKATNITEEKETSAEKFGKLDPFGIAMAIIAMSVVFSSLALLSLIFRNINKVYNLNIKAIFKRRREEEPQAEAQEEGIPGEVAAAIALALHMYQQQIHDNETTVLTIQRVSRLYSPWSSKIYGLRQTPR